MVTIGIDAHKRSHTVVAVDEQASARGKDGRNEAPHRLSRSGKQAAECCTPPHRAHPGLSTPGARDLLAHRRGNADGGLEALRVLERRLSDVV